WRAWGDRGGGEGRKGGEMRPTAVTKCQMPKKASAEPTLIRTYRQPRIPARRPDATATFSMGGSTASIIRAHPHPGPLPPEGGRGGSSVRPELGVHPFGGVGLGGDSPGAVRPLDQRGQHAED